MSRWSSSSISTTASARASTRKHPGPSCPATSTDPPTRLLVPRLRLGTHCPRGTPRNHLSRQDLGTSTGDTMITITDIRLTGLTGGTVDGGWPDGMKPEEDLNTLLEVVTSEGITGVGSVYTSKARTDAAVRLLRPILIGERADEPARVTEKLRQSTFWQGRGGAVEHAISGIDIALWDIFGKVCNQPVSRLLGGCYRTRI